jgi:hypothetical protein
MRVQSLDLYKVGNHCGNLSNEDFAFAFSNDLNGLPAQYEVNMKFGMSCEPAVLDIPLCLTRLPSR